MNRTNKKRPQNGWFRKRKHPGTKVTREEINAAMKAYRGQIQAIPSQPSECARICEQIDFHFDSIFDANTAK